MTRKPSVATDTNGPDRRMSTTPDERRHAADEDRRDERGHEPPTGQPAHRLVERDARQPARQIGQEGGLGLLRQGQDGRDVGAQRHEPDLAQGEDAREAVGQVEADREHDEDRQR